MSYTISKYTLEKAKLLDVDVKPSTNKNKKIDAFKNGIKLCSIGAIKYMDYTMYLKTDKLIAEKRRLLYHQRHKKDVSYVKYSPGWYESVLLW